MRSISSQKAYGAQFFFNTNNLIKDSSGADYQQRKHPTTIEAYTAPPASRVLLG